METIRVFFFSKIRVLFLIFKKGQWRPPLLPPPSCVPVSPYLKDIINNLKKSDTWKIQLSIANNFISSIDNDEEHVMHSKSDNIEIMINDEADEVIKELFDSLKNRYQNNLESMKGSEFVLDYVELLCYKYYKINPICVGLYIDFPDWIKNKKATINPINKKR